MERGLTLPIANLRSHISTVSPVCNGERRGEKSYIARSKNITTPPNRKNPPKQHDQLLPSFQAHSAVDAYLPPEQKATPISIIPISTYPCPILRPHTRTLGIGKPHGRHLGMLVVPDARGALVCSAACTGSSGSGASTIQADAVA